MIGTQADAQRALYGDLETVAYGSSRRVHRVGDVVYKVNKHAQWNANEDEWNKYRKIVEMVKDEAIVSVPETHLYDVAGKSVIAMQYIKGQSMHECWCIEGKEAHSANCLPKDMAPVLNKYVTDLGGENVIFDGDRYWIIDLGEGS